MLCLWRCLLDHEIEIAIQSEVIFPLGGLLHRSGQASADGGEKNLVGAVGDFVERGSPREHGLGLGQEVFADRHVRQVKTCQSLGRPVVKVPRECTSRSLMQKLA
jgi:hypothetical protein